MGMNLKHTFVICAYKESVYLEECIQSLKKQTVPSEIIMVTSTPNDWIKSNSEKYNIPLIINTGQGGIAQDWNFAYKQCHTDYVTIAHQDDIYFEKYTEEIMSQIQSDCLIAFSDYVEVRNGQIGKRNMNLKIKSILLAPLRIKLLQKNKWVRRRVLSVGNPICCPSVFYVKKNLPKELFQVHFRSNVDWETWEVLSRKKGRFLYIAQALMGHRVHEESETSATIGENVRTLEDYEMFRKFWPDYIAGKIAKIYANSEKSNKV